CQIKGSKICNMTIQAILDQFPSMHACQRDKSYEAIWCIHKESNHDACFFFFFFLTVYDGTGSCLKQMEVCLDDEICNRYLVPFVQACAAGQCNRTHCQQATRQFYSGMPYNVAEMLFMCECEAGAPNCLHIKKTLHSGTCGEETWTCQEGLNHCLADWHCRNVFETFQAKCWHAELTQCSDSENTDGECVSQMNPALVLGGDIQCKMAFLATVGTTLHYPCTCKGLHDEEMLKCNTLHDIFHNRSLYSECMVSTSTQVNSKYAVLSHYNMVMMIQNMTLHFFLSFFLILVG
uniref:GDNF/GAS1 domain-containing protein n=1 Tax=Myripristis murdjan TaxID=586833 RepID=A0A667XWR1_9TELE